MRMRTIWWRLWWVQTGYKTLFCLSQSHSLSIFACSSLSFPLQNEAIYKEDLAVLRLQYPRPQHEAPICSHYEQTRSQVRGQLVVSGWAKSDGRWQPSASL